MLRVTTTTKQTKETVVASSVTTSRTSEEYTLTRVSSEPFADAAVNDRDGSPHPTTSSRRSSTRKIRHDSKSTKYIPAEIDLSHLGSMSPSQHATDSNGENAPSIVVTTTAAEDEGREPPTQQGSGKSAVVHRVNSQRNPIPHHPTPETPVIKTNSINVGNKPASPTRFLGTPTNSGVANKHQSGHLAPALGVPGTGEPQWSVATSALDLPARHPHVRHGPSNVTNAHDTQDASAPYGEKVLGEDISGRPLNVAIPTPNDPYIGTHPQTRAKDARPSASRNPFFMGMIHGLVLNVFGFLGYFWNRSPRFPIGVLVGLGLCMMVVAIVLFAASTATGVVNAAIVLIVVGFVTACLGLSLLLCVRSK